MNRPKSDVHTGSEMSDGGGEDGAVVVWQGECRISESGISAVDKQAKPYRDQEVDLHLPYPKLGQPSGEKHV